MTKPENKRESKQISREEARWIFMNHMVSLVDYWEKETRRPKSREKLEGLMHSILATLDGCSVGVPGFALIPLETANDVEYAKENGYDYYPPTSQEWDAKGEDVYDIGGSLHDELYQHIRKEKKRPENLYGFGDFLADDATRMGF